MCGSFYLARLLIRGRSVPCRKMACSSTTAVERNWGEMWDSGTTPQCTCLQIVSISKTSGRRVKLNEIWDTSKISMG